MIIFAIDDPYFEFCFTENRDELFWYGFWGSLEVAHETIPRFEIPVCRVSRVDASDSPILNPVSLNMVLNYYGRARAAMSNWCFFFVFPRRLEVESLLI